LADTAESAPKVESLAPAVDPETACLHVADSIFDVPLAGVPEALEFVV
jgi:hypothetical protein